jgi:hypothetical protein
MKEIRKRAAVDAAATGLYVTAVGLFMYFAGQSKAGINNPLLAPIAVLLLFVSSAAITSWLVFGKPALLYLDGKKKEALKLLGYTIGFLLTLTFIVIILLITLG